jgi:hypothetical protein
MTENNVSIVVLTSRFVFTEEVYWQMHDELKCAQKQQGLI